MKNKGEKYFNFYDYVIKVLSICKIGKIYSTDPYAIENYTELEKLSMKMLGNFDELTFDKPNIFLRNVYPTPSISCRCLIFNDKGEVLLVQESSDGTYSFPGGWCDLYDSPSEAILKEIEQEAGAEVENLSLFRIINETPLRKDMKHEWDSVPSYALLFKARVKKMSGEHTHETNDIRFFDINNLPKMSRKMVDEDIKRAITAALNNEMIVD